MTVKVYRIDGKVTEYPNAHIYWEWGDDEHRNDSGFRINAMDKNFTTATAFVYPGECTKIEITSEESDKVFKRPPSESGISGKLWRIFSAINQKCKRQDEKWGEQNHEMLKCELSLKNGEIAGLKESLAGEKLKLQKARNLNLILGGLVAAAVVLAAVYVYVKIRTGGLLKLVKPP
ncbi:MAG: hypothetical protein LBF78_13610 [Treponema sp.]|jgi:hypothetical protein|nr:hypothetical protein [Treponema sp.]